VFINDEKNKMFEPVFQEMHWNLIV